MKKILILVFMLSSQASFSTCLSSAQLRDLLAHKFEQGQEIIRRTKLDGVTWSLASFYKSKPESTFQFGENCGVVNTFYNSLSANTEADQLVVRLNASSGDVKWAFYSDDSMMELVKYLHNGLASRGIRCKIVDSVSSKEKIICQNNAGAGKVAYSCFVKNLASEASNCLSN